MMSTVRLFLVLMACVIGSAEIGSQAARAAAVLMREPAEGEMRLGQRVRVDDGSCPTGQIKEVTASQLTPQGVLRTRVCVKR